MHNRNKPFITIVLSGKLLDSTAKFSQDGEPDVSLYQNDLYLNPKRSKYWPKISDLGLKCCFLPTTKWQKWNYIYKKGNRIFKWGGFKGGSQTTGTGTETMGSNNRNISTGDNSNHQSSQPTGFMPYHSSHNYGIRIVTIKWKCLSS